MMRVVFMGTPEFAVPTLRALVENGYDVIGVFTQPDRPVGRGGKVILSPVKQYAVDQGLNVIQVERIRKSDGLEALRALDPDICVTAAFGQILSQENLDVPRFGTVNVHASLLPKYRGAAPINWAIIMGEKIAGVTTMLTDAGIDTGDMLLNDQTEIGENETAGELTQRLSHMGAALLIETVKRIKAGDCPRQKQDAHLATHQPMMTKALGLIDFAKDAQAIANLVRGVNPWPGAYAQLGEGAMKIWSARVADGQFTGRNGEIVISDARRGLIVKCGQGAVELLEIQAPNAKRMQASAYLRGKPLPVGTVLNG